MNKTQILSLISDEQKQVSLANDFGEKADRINNILQLKIESNIQDIKNDIYIDVKRFVNFYINSFEDKQFNYDVFDELKISEYINLFEVKQKCSLLHYTIRHLKTVGFEEKVSFFESQLRACEFHRELKEFSIKNIFKLIYLATVYNNLTILFAILLCIMVKVVVYLPAPFKWMELYEIHYSKLNNNPVLNHVGNVLLSFFEVKTNPSFAEPVTFVGSVLFVLGKCFFIIIVVNILIDQLKTRFKI
ncbi:hypothetical protein [Mucilaginibacter phyllosphaerae]|uniref:Uncharacterized protein n=1 Tax=Mucilaginibacter phyllosphaerae TaxID=1812349 RepID=A0A4Y8AD12_9SPHI|nr:hypothetical protein [Mucilaginibacter phyllosphaerae]MBB3969385.1 hypothetical protein [Mucilaginibacter phyllosphaerae]TEW65828.1 hypothetical protein E2R65_11865 [Mucilaginibacter phyllosphaerae]GGH08116.1 hypothetical protein GCM10007352_13150 [Mucilaginibacter phyllosphaerae]